MLSLGMVCAFNGFSQTLSSKEKGLFTSPKTYDAVFTTEKLKLDGRADEPAWQQAAWTDDFVDIEGETKPNPPLKTRMKMLWGDSSLFVFAELQEPHIWAKLKKHDAIIYHDNDFEIFIDPYKTTHQYYEIEVNALNTIFDLFMPKPYRNGGDALIGYDVQGLKSAIQVNGTLNDSKDKDQSWTVEMEIPFRAMLRGVNPQKPKDGDFWRINFSRVEWDTDITSNQYPKTTAKNGKPLPEHNWVWSPQGAINMHMPERWGYVYFVQGKTTVKKASEQEFRNRLWLAYYRQKDWQKKHGAYAGLLKELGIKDDKMSMEATRKQFLITLKTDTKTFTINQYGYITSTPSL